jgi:hypothetical protein
LAWFIVLLPPFPIAGALAGGCIFAIAGWIIHVIRGRHVPEMLAYAILGGLLSLPLLLCWASWISGGILLALGGAKGVYQILFPGVLVTTAAGAFVGGRIKNHPGHAKTLAGFDSR